MRRPVLVAGLGLWAIGLLIGSVADRGVTPDPQFAVGYRVVAADLHVHAYPGDGVLPPWEVSHEARRRRLDAVALTNHNQMLPARLAALVPPPQEALLIPAEEITAPGYHMAAIGIVRTVDWRHTVAEAAADVHAQGGAAIAAHPNRLVWPAFDREGFLAIDGVEAAHAGMDFKGHNREDYAVFHSRARAIHPGIAAIGSSDYHSLEPMGLCRTYLFVRELTVAGIVEAIRGGRTVACDAHGQTYGDSDLARLVAARCRADAAWDPTAAADRVGLGCALAGLAWIVLFDGGRRSLGPAGRPRDRDTIGHA
jgi:hypothetical protein